AGAERERGGGGHRELRAVARPERRPRGADPTPGRRSGGEPTVRKPAAAPASRWSDGTAAPSARERVGTWAKVALGLLVAIGVAPGVWPYSHGCGLRLIFYLLGVTTVIAAGLWASISCWKRRLGVAHAVSQILIVWGILLMTREVLPRVGANAAALWLCPDVPLPR